MKEESIEEYAELMDEVKEIKKALNLTSTDTAILLMIIKRIEEKC